MEEFETRSEEQRSLPVRTMQAVGRLAFFRGFNSPNRKDLDNLEYEIEQKNLETENLELRARNAELEEENEKLQKLAMHDNLTGALSRDGMEEVFKRLYAGSAGNERSSDSFGIFSLIAVDIDNFGNFNKNEGHAGGDNVLENVAKTFHEHIRTNDIFCRWGGDEFFLIMPGADVELSSQKAKEIAEEIKNNSEQKITLSIGIVQVDRDQLMDTPQANFAIIRDPLHMAKNQGRDQVVSTIWTPEKQLAHSQSN